MPEYTWGRAPAQACVPFLLEMSSPRSPSIPASCPHVLWASFSSAGEGKWAGSADGQSSAVARYRGK